MKTGIQSFGLSIIVTGHSVISNLSVSIARGERVAVMGPNGSGKSTFLSVLATIQKPSSGTVTVDGLDTLSQADLIRTRIGYLPEDPPLYPISTVLEYLSFISAVRGAQGCSIIDQVRHVGQLFDLEPLYAMPCGRLSRGQRQRVGLAQAFLHTPDYLLLDEPGQGLDPVQAERFHKVLSDQLGHVTVVLSTHSFAEAAAFCRRTLLFVDGEIAADLSTEGVRLGAELEDLCRRATESDERARLALRVKAATAEGRSQV